MRGRQTISCDGDKLPFLHFQWSKPFDFLEADSFAAFGVFDVDAGAKDEDVVIPEVRHDVGRIGRHVNQILAREQFAEASRANVPYKLIAELGKETCGHFVRVVEIAQEDVVRFRK